MHRPPHPVANAASAKAVCLLGLACVMVCATCVSADPASAPGVWFAGRATRYGGQDDPWSIMNGYCGYGYLDPNKATGWDVAAISDSAYDWGTACGRCYEIACRNSVFTDNYGQTLDRSNVCYDQNASVVVMITDLCKCVYPENAYSNKRWCCGDMYHLDVSQYTFERLADPKWGVIGLNIRWVPCNYQPANLIKRISYPSAGVPAPSGWYKDMDKRPWPSS